MEIETRQMISLRISALEQALSALEQAQIADAAAMETRPMNKSLTVLVVEHSKGYLIRIEHDGASITLDRSEVEELLAKLTKMPININAP